MDKTSRLILSISVFLGIVSCIYFICLFFKLPQLLLFAFTILAFFTTYLYIYKENNTFNPITQFTLLHYFLFIICIFILAQNCYNLSLKHGQWDAWAIWNYHAKFLQDRVNWKKLFQSTECDHPDYPLFLPATIAFFSNLLPKNLLLLFPFILSLLFTFLIPYLIYSQLVIKNKFIALLIFYLFCQDVFYITRGVSQYADTPLAFFFLAAFVCMEYADKNKKYIALAALSIGICIWTKNEGSILAFIFVLFYANKFFNQRTIFYSIGGFLIPIIALLLFKTACTSSNDMIAAQNIHSFKRLFVKEGSLMIYDSFVKNMNEHFYYLKVGFFIYLILCIFQKRMPDKKIFLLISCTLAYSILYLFSPYGLDWHLETSQNRLMHQLMPAWVYVISLKFCRNKDNVNFYI